MVFLNARVTHTTPDFKYNDCSPLLRINNPHTSDTLSLCLHNKKN